MQINLIVHLERVAEDETGFVWWAESPELAGFSAAADHLPDLLRQAMEAINATIEDAQIIPQLASIQQSGRIVSSSGSDQEVGTRGVPQVLTVVAA